MKMSFYDENVCRLCLEPDGCLSIYSTDESLEEKIMFCTRIKINESDGLPNKICLQCSEKLDISYYFRLQVETADYKLKQGSTPGPIQTIETEEPKLEETIPKEEELNMTDFIRLENVSQVSIVENVSVQIEEPTSEPTEKEEIFYEIMVEEATKKPSDDCLHKKFYQCDFCGKVFKKSSQLVVHTRTHTGEKPYICDVCSKAFRIHHHLQAHKRVHTKSRPFQCAICEKSFSENSSLNRHIKIHTNDKKYECNHCSKRFITPADARKHMVHHTGERPFACKFCDKKYSDPSSLSKHNRKHKKGFEIK